MNVPNFLNNILPAFEANQLKDSLDDNVKVITSILLPQYQSLQEVMADRTFHSKDAQKMSVDITAYLKDTGLIYKSYNNPSMVDYIVEVMKNIGTLGGFLSSRIDADIGKKLVTAQMSFSKTTLLQLLDIINFYAEYSGTLINWLTHEELTSLNSDIRTKGVSPNDLQYLKMRMGTFSVANRVLGTPLSKLKAEYGEIPDAFFTEDTYFELTRSFGQDKTDPMGFASVPFPLSLIYHARLNWAERQMDQYDEVVATAKATELRIMLYRKQIAEGTGDASIEKMLEASEKKLLDLKYKRERLEKKYKLTEGA